ncbi:MAG TPA: hypothetical protein VII99_01145, partial [Bacteroidia bacterium]
MQHQPDKIKVLITSAGTASAISVIKALKKQTQLPVEIYATDMDPLAAGLYLADHFFISPAAKSSDYILFLLDKIKQLSIVAVIPIYSEEISLVALHAEKFKQLGAGTFLPDSKVINLCNDKKAIVEKMKYSGIMFPKQYSTPSEVPDNCFPVFFKPNFSSSSRGSHVVGSFADLQRYFGACPDG